MVAAAVHIAEATKVPELFTLTSALGLKCLSDCHVAPVSLVLDSQSVKAGPELEEHGPS
jgi:hypothetical protein